eukprot:2859910-Pleurochrysis_carterae.AAC.2
MKRQSQQSQVTLFCDNGQFSLLLPTSVMHSLPGVWGGAALKNEGVYFADLYTWAEVDEVKSASADPPPPTTATATAATAAATATASADG